MSHPVAPSWCRDDLSYGRHHMGIGVSIFFLAIGAILTFALNASVSGVNLDSVGVILMLVGVLGLVTSMMFWNSWGGFNNTRRRDEVVVREREIL